MQGQLRLTQREVNNIEDCLRAEERAIRRCRDYAQSARDPEVREICQNMAHRHTQHYNTLLQFIQLNTNRH